MVRSLTIVITDLFCLSYLAKIGGFLWSHYFYRTWAVRHNPAYDELLLSAGTDSTVNLWLAKVSSDDPESDSPSALSNRQEVPLLNSYTDYEDSIYGIAWSSHDPSLFASLSYDGRVVLESVKPYLQRK
ncbi:WD repeat-containing protein DWA2 [Zea mays]|uniref:WD repeat-containing protein DWA2 n=1 Tax=Zea mays TaxID=4577 RepID=A0A1D6KMY0_MAIZE|nr:WD repeat-containing protein DWA2 [Zea mays]